MNAPAPTKPTIKVPTWVYIALACTAAVFATAFNASRLRGDRSFAPAQPWSVLTDYCRSTGSGLVEAGGKLRNVSDRTHSFTVWSEFQNSNGQLVDRDEDILLHVKPGETTYWETLGRRAAQGPTECTIIGVNVD